MNKKVLILLAVVWTAALALVGFSELRPEDAVETAGGTASTAPAEPETTGQRADEADEPAASGRRAAGDKEGGSRAATAEAREGVTLKIEGEPGLRFAGSCVVDGEEREVAGRTPEAYAYEPERRLECEISSRARGPMRVTFSDDAGTNTVQRLAPEPGTLELTYTGEGLSTSASSRTNSSRITSSQQSSQTSGSGSSGASSSQSSQSSSQVSSSQSSYQSSTIVRSEAE